MQTIISEAKRLNIYKQDDSEDTLRESIREQWRKEIRAELSKAKIDSSSIVDKDVESFYNLYLFIQCGSGMRVRCRLGALLQMSKQEIDPRTVSHKKLLAFMKKHHLLIPLSTSTYLRFHSFIIDSCSSPP